MSKCIQKEKKKSDKCVLGLLGSKLKNMNPKRLLMRFVGKDLITLEKK